MVEFITVHGGVILGDLVLLQPSINGGADGVNRVPADAKRFREAAGVVAGLVGAGRALDPGGLGMLRSEEFGELRAEDRERGYAEQRREMAGAGIVADEAIGVGERVEQAIHVAERIVQHGHRPAGGFEPAGDLLKTLNGPLTRGLAGTGVNYHALSAGWSETGDLRHEVPVEFTSQRAPVFRTMRVWWRCQRPRQQQP